MSSLSSGFLVKKNRIFHWLPPLILRFSDFLQIKEDWAYMAMVLDRLFLWIFLLAVMLGSFSIILLDKQHPSDTKLASSLFNKTNSMQSIWN